MPQAQVAPHHRVVAPDHHQAGHRQVHHGQEGLQHGLRLVVSTGGVPGQVGLTILQCQRRIDGVARALAGSQDGENRLGIWLAFGFGCVFVSVILALAFTGNSLDDRRFEILRIVLALAGGGIGGVIPGFLALNMKAGAKLALRAGGGLAVFIVLYFWSPAHWVAAPSGSVNQHTSGANSPAIVGNGNTVNGGPGR